MEKKLYIVISFYNNGTVRSKAFNSEEKALEYKGTIIISDWGYNKTIIEEIIIPHNAYSI